MKQSYWKQHYVLETDADEIERHLQRTTFPSGGKQFALISFEAGKNAPCNGYLDHPFKNKHLETDKVLPPCLQTEEGWCTIRASSPQPHARTTIRSRDGEVSCMSGMADPSPAAEE